MDLVAEARAADERIRPHARETPLVEASWLGRDSGTGVRLKLETLQVTGSFKFRGALNRVLTIPEAERAGGVVAASTGNHGAAVARAAALVGVPARVFVPQTATAPKLERMRAFGAEVVHLPGDPLRAEEAGRAYAEEHGLAYVPPYNDPMVVAGQGTVGVEIARRSEAAPDAVFVALGGGGLASGLAAALKSAWPSTRVIACSPANSAVLIRSIAAGEVLDLDSEPTISDGTAGGVEPGTITFDLCREWVDDYVEVSEEAIESALRDLVTRELVLAEGASATAVAGYRSMAGELAGARDVVIVLSGANVSRETLLKVLR
jgi:threonine dehydratase